MEKTKFNLYANRCNFMIISIYFFFAENQIRVLKEEKKSRKQQTSKTQKKLQSYTWAKVSIRSLSEVLKRWAMVRLPRAEPVLPFMVRRRRFEDVFRLLWQNLYSWHLSLVRF